MQGQIAGKSEPRIFAYASLIADESLNEDSDDR